MRIWPVVLLAVLAPACARHHGGPNQPHANDVLLSREGIASHGGGGAHRCPGPNGEGDIKLTYSNGKDRVKGECRGGVRVGDWKAWYDNGAVVWKATFKSGLLHGDFVSRQRQEAGAGRVRRGARDRQAQGVVV